MNSIIRDLQAMCFGKYICISAINGYLQSGVIQDAKLYNLVRYSNASGTCTRTIVASNKNTSLHLLGFLPGQTLSRTTINYYYNFNVFFVVLDGELIEYVYMKPYLTTRHFIHHVGSGNFIRDNIGHHQIINKSNAKASILQFFVC